MNNKYKRIVLVTSGQPSLNPRLVKEADALFNAGYGVTVIYQYWNDWGTQADKTLLSQKTWKAIRVGGSPNEDRFVYWFSRNLYRLKRAVDKLFGGRFLPAEMIIGRCTQLLTAEVCRHQADMYIAHNLAALPAATIAAKKYGAKSGFDAEDFHRNEVSDEPADSDVILKSAIEDKYIPRLDYFTASSPGIASVYKGLFPQIDPVVLLNVFPFDETIAVDAHPHPGRLKLFWFSQTIGQKRGIEDVVNALILLGNENIELHLLGDLPPAAKAFLSAIGTDRLPLYLYPPIPPGEINQFAAQFDIGLALEPGFCLNNDLALSNKIFTYMQAGLAIIVSDTTAQKTLHDKYPQTGAVYRRGDAQALAGIISNYFNDREDLAAAKQESYALAREQLNWEKESEKFLAAIRQTIAD